MNSVLDNNELMDLLHKNMLEILLYVDSICKKYNIRYVLACGTLLGAIRHNGFIPWDDDLDIQMLQEDYSKFLDVLRIEIKKTNKYYLQEEFSQYWPMPYTKLRMNGTTYIENRIDPPEMHRGVFIDIFPCNNLSNSNFMRYIQFYFSRVMLARCMKARGYENVLKGISGFFIRIGSFVFPNSICLRICRLKNQNRSKFVHSYLNGMIKTRNEYPRECFENVRLHVFEGFLLPVPENYHEYLYGIYGDYMQLPPEEKRKAEIHSEIVDLNRPYTDFFN